MARILIIEDDTDTCESLKRYLSAIGHTAVCEVDGRTALKSLLRHDPDAILLDLGLPIMDGVAFLKVVRSYLRFKSLPVFVVTGSEDDASLDQLSDLNVRQIFSKGKVEFAQIRKAIDAAIM
jgi:CheY-like chemotaxis protein